MAIVIKKAQAGGQIYMSDRAKSLFTEIYPDLSNARPGLAGSITSRAEAQVIRLSMLYAIFDEQKIIDPKHLRAALAFWKYCEASAFFIFHDKAENKYERKILAALKARQSMTGTELRDLFQRHVSKKVLEKTIQHLVAMGKVTLEVHKTRGRPLTIYKKVTPASTAEPKATKATVDRQKRMPGSFPKKLP